MSGIARSTADKVTRARLIGEPFDRALCTAVGSPAPFGRDSQRRFVGQRLERRVVGRRCADPDRLAADAAYEKMSARGVEFTQEPVARFGSVDAGFRDPSGNGWKLIEARR